MDKQRWQRLETLFNKALDLTPAERELQLTLWCEGDEQLLKELQDMLFYSDEENDALETPVREKAIKVLSEKMSAESDRLPEVMGPYRIKALLAHGGMGSVYIADQLEPVEREVALKVLQLGQEAFLTRFNYEKHALAMMNHPNVARVYDAGNTTEGRPFFTMEYVEGKTFLNYCNSEQYSIEERLSLFLNICLGVEHAHRKGIVHCDLKPSNILVESEAGLVTPKIIDFGIARMVGRNEVQQPQGKILGTPAYMSPESYFEGAIDTSVDVYALGVVLYELLCGALPFTFDCYQTQSHSMIFERILEGGIHKPSKRLHHLEEGLELEDIAVQRACKPSKLWHILRGDLDMIVLKALAPAVKDRYRSIEALVRDIRCYQEDRPTIAHPPNPLRRAGLYLRRNKRLSTAALSFFLAGLTMIISLYVGIQQAKHGKRQAVDAKQYLTRVLSNCDPRELGDREFLDVFLEQAAHELDEGFDRDLQILVCELLGEIFLGWGRGEDGLKQYRALMDLTKEKGGDYLARAYSGMAQSFLVIGDNHKALELIEKALALDPPGESALNWSMLRVKADCMRKLKPALAISLYVKLIAEQEKSSVDPKIIWIAKNNLGLTLMDQAEYTEAWKYFHAVYLERVDYYDQQHLDVLSSKHHIGWSLLRQGNLEEAKQFSLDAYLGRKRILGENHSLTDESVGNLILILGHLDDPSLEERQIVRYFRARLDDIWDTQKVPTSGLLSKMNDCADALLGLSWTAETETEKQALLTLALETKEKEMGARHNSGMGSSLISMLTYADIQIARKEYTVAEDVLLDIRTQFLVKDENQLAAVSEALLGILYQESGRCREKQAIQLLSRSLPVLEEAHESYTAQRVRTALDKCSHD